MQLITAREAGPFGWSWTNGTFVRWELLLAQLCTFAAPGGDVPESGEPFL
ncbi:hypothetical protein GCM10009712_40380 [Pseudarthrobacter sulfonivorans]